VSCAAVHWIESRRTPCQSAAVGLMAVWRSAQTTCVERQHGQINVCAPPPTSHRPAPTVCSGRGITEFGEDFWNGTQFIFWLVFVYQNWNVQQFPVCMESAERVCKAISRKDRQTTNCQCVALGWTEYCDLLNGKWASSFGFEMLCVSVGQINRKGYEDNEQGTGPLLYLTALVCRFSPPHVWVISLWVTLIDKRTNKKWQAIVVR
jgi:hypothetical protein